MKSPHDRGQGHADAVVKFEGRESVLPLAETHQDLDREDVRRVVKELGLDMTRGCKSYHFQRQFFSVYKYILYRTVSSLWCRYKIIVAILESSETTKILGHLGLPARAPMRSPAKGFELIEPI